MIFPNLASIESLEEKIAIVENSDLEGRSLRFPKNLSFLGDFEYYRLRGKYELINKKEMKKTKEDIVSPSLIGLYSLQSPFCYIIDAYSNNIHIFFGSMPINNSSNDSLLKSILTGYFGSGFVQNDNNINHNISQLDKYSICGAITGVPGNISSVSPMAPDLVPVDNWLRSLQGKRWTYLVCGFCIPRQEVTQFERDIITEIAFLKTRILRDDIIYDKKRTAEQYQSLLEANLKRLGKAKLTGAWQIGIYVFADDEIIIRQGLGLISAAFGGKRSIIQPIRTHICLKDESLQSSFSNLLTSSEVAPLISLPSEEVPGYSITKVAQFDNDFINEQVESFYVGNIISNWIVTDNLFKINISDLKKHGLIVGVTGSGKTTTCFHILKQLKQINIPFLVIESAKSEYRNLLNNPDFKDLLIFTLGDETPENSAPFRLNPFEVPDGILIQTHLDFLKALFRASFVMYAPMPYVLEEALYEVYKDKGWNFANNTNERGVNEKAFPTLTDLYEKIDDVVLRLGYEERITKDLLAGLRTRINNLRLGGKGMMLDTQQSVSIDEIMRKPVLLELKKLGNDDEKAFLIGLILTRIYEYYEGKAGNLGNAEKLNHLTLIEEAHRLLKNVSNEGSEFTENVRGMAVETFCNMLSEIRAYGEGVLVSEQIPTKLARDIIKNTNLKVLHRLVAEDDREVIGGSMNLSDEQKDYATTLNKGTAIVFAEGMDAPFLIYVPMGDLVNINRYPILNSTINQHMKSLYYEIHDRVLAKYAECSLCSIEKRSCEGIRERIIWLDAKPILHEVFNRTILTTVWGELDGNIVKEIDAILREGLITKDDTKMHYYRLCYLIHYANKYFADQGMMYSIQFNDISMQINLFVNLFDTFISAGSIDREAINAFRDHFKKMRNIYEPPFAGCYFCEKSCVFRYEVANLLHYRDLNADFQYILNIKNDDEMWIDLAKFCKNIARRLFNENSEEILKGLALCYLAQKGPSLDLPPRLQVKLIKNVKEIYEKGVVNLLMSGGT